MSKHDILVQDVDGTKPNGLSSSELGEALVRGCARASQEEEPAGRPFLS